MKTKQNMKSLLWYICYLMLFVSPYSTEGCETCLHFVLKGEPVAISCPKFYNIDYNLTWYRNGSDIPVSTERHSRVHQRENFLWFIPANLEDSGFYTCNIRKANSSEKTYVQLSVFKNDNDLCFNENTRFDQKVFTLTAGKITCPLLGYFKDENNTASEIQWYKECKPGLLEDPRFQPLKGQPYLTIKNVTLQDKGNYTCLTTYMHMGKFYNVSRTINLDVEETPVKKKPEFIYPNNNTIKVDFGSHVVMDCKVSSGLDGLTPYWQVNDSDVDIFDNTYKEEYYEKQSPHGLLIAGAKFNISKVTNKDYLYKFFCRVFYPHGHATVYIKLEHPVPNIHGYLIGGGVSLVFVIVLAVVIYKFFKIDIVLWYRKSCHIFLLKKVSDGKLYDAYVLYPKNQVSCIYSPDIFALKILPEVLERQCGYNLFILGRDDLPGEAVINVVDETIHRSRRIIIVLIPESSCYNVLEDTSEQQLAVYNALIRDGIKVILIELSKIKDYASMPESIRYVKEKHGAIRWKGDFSERSHSANTTFWKNVRYQMPPRANVAFSEQHLLPKTFSSPQTPVLER